MNWQNNYICQNTNQEILIIMFARSLFLIVFTLFLAAGTFCFGQDEEGWPYENNLSDPLEGRRSFDILGDVFSFGPGQSFYSGRLAFQYALGQQRKHLAGVDVPLIFSDYQGLSSKLGFGDIRLKYYFFPVRNDSGKKFKSLGIGLEAFAPTGKEEDGLSRGDWVMLATAKAGFRLHPRWALYPVARYVFSFSETYSLNISAPPINLPEPIEEDELEKVSALHGEFQVVFEIPTIAAYAKLTPQLLYDLKTSAGSFSFFTMFGKMFNEKFGINLGFAVQVAGQRSFNTAWHIGIVSYLK